MGKCIAMAQGLKECVQFYISLSYCFGREFRSRGPRRAVGIQNDSTQNGVRGVCRVSVTREQSTFRVSRNIPETSGSEYSRCMLTSLIGFTFIGL
jgi:hypothetical protein